MNSRDYYMNKIDKLFEVAGEYGYWETMERILDKYGASEDDSDPDEGYYVSMDLDDLRNAYNEIVDYLKRSSDPAIRYKIYKNQPNLTEYEQGWVDGYEACSES